MAGTLTVANPTILTCGDHVFYRYRCLWTSSAGGAVSGNNFSITPGFLQSIRFIPGSTTPSDLYDATLIDNDGAVNSGDLLSGAGADLSNTLAVLKTFDPPLFEDGTRTLDLVIANAGATKTGSVDLVIQVK